MKKESKLIATVKKQQNTCLLQFIDSFINGLSIDYIDMTNKIYQFENN